jgi:hypothetical protein
LPIPRVTARDWVRRLSLLGGPGQTLENKSKQAVAVRCRSSHGNLGLQYFGVSQLLWRSWSRIACWRVGSPVLVLRQNAKQVAKDAERTSQRTNGDDGQFASDRNEKSEADSSKRMSIPPLQRQCSAVQRNPLMNSHQIQMMAAPRRGLSIHVVAKSANGWALLISLHCRRDV